jgi:hypothetical protein
LKEKEDRVLMKQRRLRQTEGIEKAIRLYITQFFTVIDRPTALFFWNTYPSLKHLDGVTVEQLAKELRVVSHNQCSTKWAQKILDLIATDGLTLRNYQNERDFITRNLVKVLEFQNNELTAIEKEIERMLVQFDCKLTSIKGVNTVDKPHVPGQKPHVHFKDGTAMNNDGTVHDAHNGTPDPSNKTSD